ncbi:hypothetical protein WAI453_009305 [Rhynchosporium graminicola]
MAISIGNVHFEHHREFIGIGESRPRISWRFEGDTKNWTQRSYDVEIRQSETLKIYSIESPDSVLVPWPGKPLASGELATVRVRVFGGEQKTASPWSESVTVETGLLNRDDWSCSLIAAGQLTDVSAPKRPVLFRRIFDLKADVLKARIYITAQGVYEAHLNGKRIGDHMLAPGWTSYTHHLAYQTFDVTNLLQSGENVLSVQVGEGWFCGRLGFLGGKKNIWGDTIGLIAQLKIQTTDGQVIVINSDSEWKSSTGSLITSELYDGEVCDLKLEQKGWQTQGQGFDDRSWGKARTFHLPSAMLVAPDGPPVRQTQEIEAISAFKSPIGKTIVDFGQNLVGWVRIRLSGPRGRVVKLLFTEVLEDGEVATRPLRDCKATDTITLSGEDYIWEPKFTFHGFRYMQVDGLLSEADSFDLKTATAVVIHTDMEQTGWFDCSNPRLNQLHENIRWGMRGNFLSIPTDCPQRDERLGWTGDIHVFAPTANYLYDTCGMLQGWAKDLSAEQLAGGSSVPPFFCPNVFLEDTKYPTAIWGDVMVGLPWDLYKFFGDSKILKQQFESMRAWVDKGIDRDETGLWKADSYQFGDWLDPKAPSDEPGNSVTDPHLVANAYLVHVTSLIHKISVVLGFDELAERYGTSAIDLKSKFQDRYITNEGRVLSDSQTAIALSIHFRLFKSESQEMVAARRLKDLILRNSRFKIATGFAGTPIIGHALSRVGEAQLFYRMLYHRKAPSWLYQVTMGATTMWERWDSMLPDGRVNPGEMTSFNHYALGAVAEWMHRNIGGLSLILPGWKKFRIAPVPGGDLTYGSARFLSPYGWIEAKWSIQVDEFLLKATVPPNTTAEVLLPGDKQDHISVGSGIHEFRAHYKHPKWPPIPIYPQYYLHDDDEP